MYKDGELLAITYDVWINGSKLGIDKKQCITDINVKETVEGADICTIKLADPEFLYLEDDLFVTDAKVKVNLGWVGVTYRETFEGYISTLDIEFPDTGIPTMTITCMDRTHVMNRKKNSRTFKNTTNADVVQQIVRSYGFKCVIESDYSFKVQETITQSNQTDIDFITNLAGDEVYPFTARLKGDTFYYVKQGHLGNPVMSLTYLNYPHEIINFSPKINKESKQVEISDSSASTSNKKATTTKVTTSGSSKKSSSGGSSNNSGKTHTYNPATKKWS